MAMFGVPLVTKQAASRRLYTVASLYQSALGFRRRKVLSIDCAEFIEPARPGRVATRLRVAESLQVNISNACPAQSFPQGGL